MSVQALRYLPVKMEMSICLNDADNKACLALVDMDLYTFGAKSSRCFPQPQKCLPGLVIKKSVPDAMNTSFTVTITGHHLSNNAISTILPTDYINISLVYVTDWSYSYCLRIGLSVAVMARSKFVTRHHQVYQFVTRHHQVYQFVTRHHQVY